MPVARPTMLASANRRVEYAVGAELHLQTERQLEDAALAFHQLLLADILRGCNRPRLRRNITMRSSRFISSRSVALIRSAMVFGALASCRRRLPLRTICG